MAFSNPRRTFQILIVIALLLPVAALAYNGTFTRMMADDYCFANVARERGVWGALDYWYNNWTGTPSSTFGQSIVALLGPAANALTPAFLLAAWLAALTWALYQLAMLLRLDHPRFLAFLFAALLVYGVTAGIPNVYQALFWTSGTVVYTGPLSLLSLVAGLILWAARRQVSGGGLALTMLMCAAATFISGGLTQTVATMQAAGLALAFAGVLWKTRRQKAALAVTGAGLIGAGLALVVTLVAPGNAVREAAHPLERSLVEIAVLTVQNTAAFVAMSLAFFSLIPMLVCGILAAIMAREVRPAWFTRRLSLRQALKWMAAVAGIGLVLIAAYLAPAAYGMGKMPASRAWVVPMFVLALVGVAWGVLAGLSLKNPLPISINPYPPAPLSPQAEKGGVKASTGGASVSPLLITLVVALLVIGPGMATLSILRESGRLSVYAAEWDAQDVALRQAGANGEHDVLIKSYSTDMADYANLDKTEPGTSYYDCMRAYYGVAEI